MSLLYDAMEECVFIHRTTKPDGQGGYISEYSEGAEFKAAIVYDTSLEARVAAVQGITGSYTVSVPKSVEIGYHDAFVRRSDGQVFRCVSKDDSTTPEAASFKIRQFKAEEWVPS